MIADVVTTRWATALFNLARRQGVLSEVAADLERLAEELARPALRAWLARGGRSRRAGADPLASLVGGFHPLTRDFVGLVREKRREPVLARAASAFHRCMLQEQGAVEGVVESARELPAESIARLAASMSKRLSKQVRLEGRVVPELVAGVRVLVGSQMIDRSVRGRLEALRSKLYEARVGAGGP